MVEIWKDVAGHEGIYQISNCGRVKRLARYSERSNQVGNFTIYLDEYIFKQSYDTKGYPQVLLTIGTKRVARVHRLVAEAFLKPPSDELLNECKLAGLSYVPVNHIDHNPKNNLVTNLEWCSAKWNVDWCSKNNRANKEKVSGSLNKNSLLKEHQVFEILDLLAGGQLSQEAIGEIYGVSQLTVSNIKTGRSWSHLTGIPPAKKSRSKREAVSISEQEFIH